ncbi:hypothetical protein [Actinoallomurus sp. NPDC050550]|uniref:hypothetical protein n=1 Tax=Actinoallomurus sp. NPDC050550 TaxID=3154937 RepID=UPI0033D0451C
MSLEERGPLPGGRCGSRRAVPAVGRRLGDWTGRVVVDMTNQCARFDPYRGFADVAPLFQG